MGLTVAPIGTGNNAATPATTAVITLTAAVAEGDFIIVCTAQDNGGGGGAISMLAPIDSKGNSYNAQRAINYDPGTVRSGITQGIYLAGVTTAMAIGDTITMRSSAADAISGVAWKVSPTTGYILNTVSVSPTGGTAGATATSATITTGSLAVGDAVIGVTSLEPSAATAPTVDNDTLNGSWSTAQRTTTTNATIASRTDISSQYKIVTAAGAQTYNTTFPTAKVIIGYVSLTSQRTPDAITDLVAVPGNGYVSLYWTPPFDGGSRIWEYDYRMNGGAWTTASATAPAPSFVKTGLTNGTLYTFEVRAKNVNGGPAATSNLVSSTPRPDPIPNTISYVAGTGAGSTNGSSVTTPAIDTTGANLLVMCVNEFPTTPTITDSKGNTWLLAVTAGPYSTYQSLIYYAKNAIVGTGHTFTVSTPSHAPSVQVGAFSGASTDPLDVTGFSGSNTALTSISLTATGAIAIRPAAARSLTVQTALHTNVSVTSGNSGGGYADMGLDTGNTANNVGSTSSYLIQTAAPSTPVDNSFSGHPDWFVIAGASFKPAPITPDWLYDFTLMADGAKPADMFTVGSVNAVISGGKLVSADSTLAASQYSGYRGVISPVHLVAMEVKFLATGGTISLFAASTVTTINGVAMNVNQDGTWGSSNGGTPDGPQGTAATFPLNTAILFHMVYNEVSGAISLYADGVLLGSGTTTTKPSGDYSGFTISNNTTIGITAYYYGIAGDGIPSRDTGGAGSLPILGTALVQKLYVAATLATKLYIGSTQIYPGGTAPPAEFTGPKLVLVEKTSTVMFTNSIGHVQVYIPHSAVVGHVAYISITSTSGVSVGTPAGWTVLSSSTDHKVYRKVLVSGDIGSSPIFPMGVANQYVAVTLLTVSGANATTPENAVGTLVGPVYSASQTAIGPTTTVANCLALAFVGGGGGTTGSTWTVSSPWTEIVESHYGDTSSAAATLEVAAAGTIPNATFTIVGNRDVYASIIAVAPA